MSQKWLWFVLIVLLLILALPLLAIVAQDTPTPEVGGPVVISIETPTPAPVIVEPPPPDPVTEEPGDPPATTPENLLGQFYALLKDGTFIAWAAAGVVVIVGLLKILASVVGLTIEGNSAILLTLIVQVLVWLMYAIANYFGQGEAVKNWYLQVVDVLRALLPLAGSIFAGHLLYAAAAKRSVPVLGFKPKSKALSVNVH